MIKRFILKFYLLAREHWLILVCALLLTTLVLSPAIAFPYLSSAPYQGINVPTVGGANVYEYLMRGKDALQGFGLGSSALREGKNNPDYYFSISEYILVAPWRLLGLADHVDIVTIYLVDNFIGVYILLLLIYLFAFQLSKNKLLSTVAALGAIGGYSIIYNKTLFYTDFNIYGRSIYPYVGSVFFFIYLNLLCRCLTSNHRRYIYLAGGALGLLFYIYFFAWTFACALTATLGLVYLLRRDFIALKKIILVGLIGLALGLFNLWRIKTFLSSSAGLKFKYFSWSAASRTPIFSKIGFGALLLWLVLWLFKKSDSHRWLLLGLILGGSVALNQQVITGRAIQYAHYYWFFIVPLCIILGVYMLSFLLPSRIWQRACYILIIGITFLNTGVGQYRSTQTTLQSKSYEQRYRPIIDYLNQTTTPVVILAADDVHETLFTIYTNHDLFWYSFALMDTTPLKRAEDALLVYLYLNKNSRANVSEYLSKSMQDPNFISNEKSLYQALEGYRSGLDYYTYAYRGVNDLSLIGPVRERTIAEITTAYQNLVMTPESLLTLLHLYGVKYIVWDKLTNPEWDLTGLPGLSLRLESGNVSLYQLEN